MPARCGSTAPPIHFPTAQAAQAAGVTAIHQETVLFDELSVAENIFIGHAPRTRWGLVDWATMRRRAAEVLARIEVSIDPATRLKDLSIAQRHLVAIARALSVEARIVIMDEPTAALSYKEAEDLFRIVEGLRQAGKAILFISHKFDEVYRIADDYVVFRDGSAVGAGTLAEIDRAELVRLMVGRKVEQVFPQRDHKVGATILTVSDYRHPTEFDGHFLRVAARRDPRLLWAGRRGAVRADAGLVRRHAPLRRPHPAGRPGRSTSARRPMRSPPASSMCRKNAGGTARCCRCRSWRTSPCPLCDRTARHGFLRMAEEFALARKYAERLDLRASSLSQPVGTLSGGNQQKVVVGKWLATGPKVIVLDEPTKGVDIGSKAAIHAFMGELAAEGLAIIMVSSEIPEILGMSDRVVVMREGRMVGTFERADLSPEALVRAATGNVKVA